MKDYELKRSPEFFNLYKFGWARYKMC